MSRRARRWKNARDAKRAESHDLPEEDLSDEAEPDWLALHYGLDPSEAGNAGRQPQQEAVQCSQ
jgi:hypothetical protein